MDRTQFQLFNPHLKDMVEAEKLFYSSPSHRIDYYTSAERMGHVPALKQPEVGGQSYKSVDWPFKNELHQITGII